MDRTSWMKRVGMLLGAASAMAGCGGKAIPCSGTNCYDISGGYLVTYQPHIACPDWVFQQDPTSTMSISAANSVMTMSLTPSAVSPSHTLNGTENTLGNVSVTEPDTASSLGIPYAEVNGTFTPVSGTGTSPPFQFTGSLLLIPTGAMSTADGGSGGGCSASYTINAQQQTDANGNPIGTGTPTDGG